MTRIRTPAATSLGWLHGPVAQNSSVIWLSTIGQLHPELHVPWTYPEPDHSPGKLWEMGLLLFFAIT